LTKEQANYQENRSVALSLEELHKAAHKKNTSFWDSEDEYNDDDADCYFD